MLSIKHQDIQNMQLSFIESQVDSIKRQSYDDVEAALKPPVVKQPISNISRNFKPLTLQEKREKMSSVVTELLSESKAYFSGKQLRIKNKASYFQCVENPNEPKGYIAAQDVSSSATGDVQNVSIAQSETLSAREERQREQLGEEANEKRDAQVEPPPPIAARDYLMLKPGFDDNYLLLMDQTEDLTIGYAITERGKCKLDPEAENLTLFSFWSRSEPSSSPEYECTNFIIEQNVLKQAEKDALFSSKDGQIFFFSEDENNQLRINVLQGGQRGAVTRFVVPLETTLSIELRYQLLEHHKEPKANFSYPPPSLITLGDESFLVMTVLLRDRYPCIMFFSLRATKSQSERDIYSSQGFEKGKSAGTEIAGEPTHRIEGADLFLDTDPKDSSIRFLASRKEIGESVGLEPEVVRLLYPSVVR